MLEAERERAEGLDRSLAAALAKHAVRTQIQGGLIQGSRNSKPQDAVAGRQRSGSVPILTDTGWPFGNDWTVPSVLIG